MLDHAHHDLRTDAGRGPAFFHRHQPIGLLYALDDRIGVERAERAQIDHLRFDAVSGETLGGFQRRADQVARLLASAETTFLLVTVPLPEPMTEADFFWRALRERDLPFGGVVVNKVRRSYVVGHARSRIRGRAARALAAAGVADDVAGRAAENLLDFQSLADRDRANIERLQTRLGAELIVEVPLLDHDVHDLAGLSAVSAHLLSGT